MDKEFAHKQYPNTHMYTKMFYGAHLQFDESMAKAWKGGDVADFLVTVDRIFGNISYPTF